MSVRRARIAVLGAGWWSQGWHLPHLSRNPEVKIAAIIEPNPNPRSAINELESTAALGEKYGAPTFSSLDACLAEDPDSKVRARAANPKSRPSRSRQTRIAETPSF